MYRLSFVLIACLSLVRGEEYALSPIGVEETQENDFLQTQKEAQQSNAFTLQERLQQDVSFDTVGGEKNGMGLSFRGIDARATGYYEDGIPLYRTVNGEMATLFFAPSGDLTLSQTSPSSNGVASMGADIEITTRIPTQTFESTLLGSLTTNDTRFSGYMGSRIGKHYVQFNASTYRMESYTLSNDFKATMAQPEGERLNSDKKQYDVSLKAGSYLGNHGHVAAKFSTSRSEFGVPHNVYVDTSAAPWTIPLDSYTRVNQKDLNSLYLYGDYVNNQLETTLRAYHDRYKDIFDWYETSEYNSFLFPSSLYDDSRTGVILKTALNSSSHTDAIVVQKERNSHKMIVEGSVIKNYESDSTTLSYLGEYALSSTLQMQGAISYRQVQPRNELSQRDMIDYQLKLTQKISSDELYMAAAHKSRFPSMDELFDFFGTANPDLKPEQSRTLEAGYTFRPSDSTTATIEGYSYDIKDLILKSDMVFINRKSAKHYGFEGRIKSDAFHNHHLSSSYRYAHAQESGGERLELIPMHRFSIQDTIDIAPFFTLSGVYGYVGNRSSSYLNQRYNLKEYQTLDVYLNYAKDHGMSYRFGVKNLTDEAYEWKYGYPVQGRSFFATLSWTL